VREYSLLPEISHLLLKSHLRLYILYLRLVRVVAFLPQRTPGRGDPPRSGNPLPIETKSPHDFRDTLPHSDCYFKPMTICEACMGKWINNQFTVVPWDNITCPVDRLPLSPEVVRQYLHPAILSKYRTSQYNANSFFLTLIQVRYNLENTRHSP
jgi:hypothetical protein